MTDDLIKRAEEAMEGTTEGPWQMETVRTSCGVCHRVGPFPRPSYASKSEGWACVYDDYPPGVGSPDLVANARFIAASRSLVSELVERVKESEARAEKAEAALAAAPDVAQAVATDAARDVLTERARQISAEGWTPEHDDAHDIGELATAAACYALLGSGVWSRQAIEYLWPRTWAKSWLKYGPLRRMLVKAGALILAEIERLDRAAIREGKDG